MAKELFSAHSNVYAKYRPSYPPELFNYILGFVKEKACAWDCATGNGQAAKAIADHFQHVDATDISEAQLQNAVQKSNIRYQVSSAEHTPFASNSFDLITIATAYHWLNWSQFYDEATRVGKPECVVAAWAYHLLFCDDEAINQIIQHFYYDTVKPYWDYERKYVDESYKTVAFDFSPLPSKDFDLALSWSKESFLGYLSTWSAVQNYARQNGTSPMKLIEEELRNIWKEAEEKDFHFPLFLRIGRITK